MKNPLEQANLAIEYVGVSEGVGHDHVLVSRDGVTAPLAHHVRHSPSGFSWGYGGSGPAETARCILADFLDIAPLDKPAGVFGPGSLPEIDMLYQQFKFDVIASLPQGLGWTITGATIAEWLVAHPLPVLCPVHRVEYDDEGVCFDCAACPTCKGDGRVGPHDDECSMCNGEGVKQ